MNLDIFRKEPSTCIVRSKFFAKTAMDDSSDFQATKKSITGPKNVTKKTVKPKKAPKKIKGQKDIRKVLKSKNELESYSKDFDKVCKQSGIDVDPEQLQLAIALSKSLQTGESKLEGETSKSITTQERVGKIRSTLLEYGFKVPEIKITGSKKFKNYRKKYKLLQTSEAEKQQIIANKYSKILFEDITIQTFCNSTNNTYARLYNLATNAPYDVLKNNETFYIDLIEQSSASGNLLRDWSRIPGRPVSPTITETIIMNFSEIECSQDEVDAVLSGPLKICQDLIKKKSKFIEIIDDHDKSGKTELVGETPNILDVEENVNSGSNSISRNSQKALENNEVINLIDPSCTAVHRSCSPDIFDDEFSVIDTSKNPLCQEKVLDCQNDHHLGKNNESIDLTDCIPRSNEATLPVVRCTNVTKRISNDFMEMTECVEIKELNTVNSQLSQKNITKIRSDDYMEITNCVAPAINQVNCDIDLTQIPDENEVFADTTNVSQTNNSKLASQCLQKPLVKNMKEIHIDLTQNDTIAEVDVNNDEKMADLDLTQSSKSSDDLPVVLLSNSKTNSADNTILIDPKEYEKIPQESCGNILDLTENGIECINPPKGSFFEEFVHDHSDNNECSNENDNSIENVEDKIDLTQNSHRNVDLKDDIDLTQNSDTSDKIASQKLSDNCELEVNNHNNSTESVQDNVDLTQNYDKSRSSSPGEILNAHDIDLTQNTDSSNEIDNGSQQKILDSTLKNDNQYEMNEGVIKTSQRYSSLGKKDDISIDYDEVSVISNNKSLNSTKNTSLSDEHHNNDIMNDLEVDLAVINDFDENYYCSQNSEVFQISDKELDYSLNKSKLEKPTENFHVGLVSSILDDLSKAGSLRKSKIISDCNESLIIADYGSDNEQILSEPTAYTNNEISPIKHKRINEISTPKNASTSGTLVETPNNSQYFIKTNNVTPMPQYESMSTPEIHKELDKYGIKPFKRKRAIQLLSHIYNQTHPVIEYSDDTPSPAKKQRLKSPKKRLTPKKLITSPKASQSKQVDPIAEETKEIQNKEVVYEETNDPVLKEVVSNPEDWVFQKREKAKVHSCRVPLHITFHNYVTSRQGLHEAILCYQPINIDVVHKDLVSYGHRYDPKDLLKFLDKNCITVKTTDNDSRNNKRY